jgi:4-hydroxy-4-methyl-2-oxoglutarate aldolase
MPLDAKLIRQAAAFSSATLHEAMGKRGALPYGIKPIFAEMKVCGPALTVGAATMDNLPLHRAIAVAQAGDVLVVEVGGGYEAGYFGEIMTVAAQSKKIAGLVIDGCVRDGELIRELGFSVFSRGLSIRGTDKNDRGRINQMIKIGDVTVNAGDLVVGDGDGVVVVPTGEVAEVLAAAQKREDKETQIKKYLVAGKTTLELYGWR